MDLLSSFRHGGQPPDKLTLSKHVQKFRINMTRKN